jgi:hypothetical protein
MSCSLSAQNYCGSSRYDQPVFTNIAVTSDITFGSNKSVTNQTVTLKLDIYEPAADTATIRPLIILAHGGSFINGDKLDLSYISTELAKRGYVVASINYRLGLGFPIDSTRAMRAVWRAMQDMKASVRFFRKDAATANVYKIDTNMIFIGGASAGSIVALHYAYLDQPGEIPSMIDTTSLGGLEGTSGTPGYSTAVKAVVNICGALADTAWMKPGDEPLVSVQGNDDGTVPYCSDFVYLASFKIMVVHGSGTLAVRALQIGMVNPIHTFYDQGHSSPGDAINIDTTIALAGDFLYKQMGCTPTGTVNYENTPLCLTGLGVHDIVLNSENVSLYPNPAKESVSLTLKEVKEKAVSGEIHDLVGRSIRKFEFSGDEFIIERKNLPNGVYFLKLKSDTGELYTTKIIFTE